MRTGGEVYAVRFSPYPPQPTVFAYRHQLRSKGDDPWERRSTMIDKLMNLLFRCRHRRLSRPLSRANKTGGPQGRTYVVCLDCGKQFAYDTVQMRLGKAIDPT